jgi:hypothetical protein
VSFVFVCFCFFFFFLFFKNKFWQHDFPNLYFYLYVSYTSWIAEINVGSYCQSNFFILLIKKCKIFFFINNLLILMIALLKHKRINNTL